MAFTGKATYTAGASLPEIAEDVADLVSVVSPLETPLLDVLGDSGHPARSTIHEWLEDQMLANVDTIDDDAIANPTSTTTFGVSVPLTFRVGDQVRLGGADEIMLVTAVDEGGGTITVVRGYGSSSTGSLSDGARLQIIGNASLEGADASDARYSTRSRRINYTQIFASTIEVSGSELAVNQIGVADELDYQKQARLRELLRDLEATIVNGRSATANSMGSSSVRRTMNGLLAMIGSNVFVPGVNDFPTGTRLTEKQLNTALGRIWTNSSARIDLIVVNGQEKRALNDFVGTDRRFYDASESVFHDGVSAYESDYGVCRVVLCRSVPKGTVLLLDSSRIEVKPLNGRSFHYRPLAQVGDRETGQLIGEYTLELRNENAHAVIKGFTG